MHLIAGLLCATMVLLGGASSHALADGNDYFGRDAPAEQVSFQVDKSRTTKQKIIIGSLFGGGAVFGGIGVLFHLDSRSASDEVSAVGEHTGLVYTPELDDARDRAYRSRALAAVSYGLAGACLIAAAVVLIVTEPGSERYTVGEKKDTAPPVGGGLSVAPTRGGAYVAGTWSF